MIKADDLREFRPQYRYTDGLDITLATVQAVIKEAAAERGLPVAFKPDQVKSGSLFSPTIENCVVLYHPEHENDYYKICIRVSYQGNCAFVSINDFGKSRLEGNAGSRDFLKETLKHGSGAEKVGALIGAGARRIIKGGANKVKFEQEQQYYTCIADLFDDVIA